MEEAQELSSRIAIMDHGRIIASGTNEELVQIVGEQSRIDFTWESVPDSLVDAWRGVEGVRKVTASDGAVSVLADDSNVVLPRLFAAASTAGVRISSVSVQEPNLETVFLHLTGRALRE
jgi:ABC-2 type transport system ATP-binding protein